LLALAAPWAFADEGGDIFHGPLEKRVDALAAIQPGLGVVMQEFGFRFSNMHFAANGGNWGLAQYELKELVEAQEVAELTRPQRAPMLKAFEASYLKPLDESIEKQDLAQFNQRFKAAMNGCNACHAALGFGFIEYRLPSKAVDPFLNFSRKTKPTYEEKREYEK
jgi:hypothetical protein